nr:hypothetical protein [Pandoravirus massiliensis]
MALDKKKERNKEQRRGMMALEKSADRRAASFPDFLCVFVAKSRQSNKAQPREKIIAQHGRASALFRKHTPNRKKRGQARHPTQAPTGWHQKNSKNIYFLFFSKG